jgi:signal transduction histidine kinase
VLGRLRLTNSVKFTPDGGTVTVRVRQLAGQVTISVSDTGIGIPYDEQDKLFTRFFRSSTAQELAIRGTGPGWRSRRRSSTRATAGSGSTPPPAPVRPS